MRSRGNLEISTFEHRLNSHLLEKVTARSQQYLLLRLLLSLVIHSVFLDQNDSGLSYLAASGGQVTICIPSLVKLMPPCGT